VVTKLHFIAGLPRSGSTLVGALLRQNPRFVASITSPVAALCGALTKEMSGASEFVTFFDDGRRKTMLRAIFDGYYASSKVDQVVFDTNRIWTSKAAWLSQLYPNSRIICCVRDIGWIVDSLERMLRANPLQLSRALAYEPGTSVYARVEWLINSDNGLIGLPWSAFREAWFGESADRLVVIPYDTLVREPERTLRRLYDAIGEHYFPHDFEHVSYDEPEYDSQLGMPGLHRVRSVVKPETRIPSIPPDIFAKYADTNFWRDSALNHRSVRIL
jgi:sulfotransferase